MNILITNYNDSGANLLCYTNNSENTVRRFLTAKHIYYDDVVTIPQDDIEHCIADDRIWLTDEEDKRMGEIADKLA